MNTNHKPNIGFWIIAVLALLWNLMGVYQFYLGSFALESLKDSVTFEEYSVMESLPSWYTVLFAIAVFSGLIATFLLLARKKLAVLLYALSLVFVVIIELYWLFATDILEVSGNVAATMPILVILIALFLYFYSKSAARKGWLR